MDVLKSLLDLLPLISIETGNEQYFLEKKERFDGRRILHKENCNLLPEGAGKFGLGRMENREKAFQKAKHLSPEIKYCFLCCKS